jgi:hypothetical protein
MTDSVTNLHATRQCARKVPSNFLQGRIGCSKLNHEICHKCCNWSYLPGHCPIVSNRYDIIIVISCFNLPLCDPRTEIGNAENIEELIGMAYIFFESRIECRGDQRSRGGLLVRKGMRVSKKAVDNEGYSGDRDVM